MTLKASLFSILLKPQATIKQPFCFIIHLSIYFTIYSNGGMGLMLLLLVNLSIHRNAFPCVLFSLISSPASYKFILRMQFLVFYWLQFQISRPRINSECFPAGQRGTPTTLWSRFAIGRCSNGEAGRTACFPPSSPAAGSCSNSSIQLQVWEATAVHQQPQTGKSTSFALHEQPTLFACADCEHATLWSLYWTATCVCVCVRALWCLLVLWLQPALIIHRSLLAPRQT